MDFATFNIEVKQSLPTAAVQDGLRPMRHHLLQTCGVKLNTLEAWRMSDMPTITEELHQPERKRVAWEIYCGGARVSALAKS